MAQEKNRCLICGKSTDLKGSICHPCQERIRGEALGRQNDLRSQADKALEKHGRVPKLPPKENPPG